VNICLIPGLAFLAQNRKFKPKNDLPGCLADTGDLTLIGQLSEADTAYAVISQVSVGSAADLAAVVAAGGELGFSLLL
jgi:hypothetical protein